MKLEPENPHDPDNDPNPRLFIQFIKEVSEAIKSIDPLHMVTTGMDRFHFADWDELFDLYKARAEALGA